MTTIKITVGGTVVEVEPAKPRTTTVYNVGVSSPQAVIQRIEEAQRREAAMRRAGMADPTTPSPSVDDSPLEVADRRDEQGQGAPEIAVTIPSALLASLNHLLDEGGCDWHVRGDLPLERGAELIGAGRGSAAVAEVDHDSSPSSGCGDTTVGDGGGPGSRIEQPGPAPTVILSRFMDALGVKPAAQEECVEFFLRGDDVGQVFGLDPVAYLRRCYGLAAEFQFEPYQAGLMIDALATALRGAR
ncbi:hypothetical protein GCM10027289_27750 [Tsukamurella serpentis]